MSIFMQVKEPVTRLELVDLIHSAFREVKVQGFRGLSDPKRDVDLRKEKPDWQNPNVGGYQFRDYANPVVYQRATQSYWQEILTSATSRPDLVQDIQDLQSQFQALGLRADSGLGFIAGQVPENMHELGDYPIRSPESRILEQIARYLLHTSPKIERVAITAKDSGKSIVHEVR